MQFLLVAPVFSIFPLFSLGILTPQQVDEMVRISLRERLLGARSGKKNHRTAKFVDNVFLDGQMQRAKEQLRAALEAYKAKQRLSRQMECDFVAGIGVGHDFLRASSDGKMHSQITERELAKHEHTTGALYRQMVAEIADQQMDIAHFREIGGYFERKCFSPLFSWSKKRTSFGLNQLKLVSLVLHSALYRQLLNTAGCKNHQMHYSENMSHLDYALYWLDKMVRALKQAYIVERTEFVRALDECDIKQWSPSLDFAINVADARTIMESWDEIGGFN